MSGGAERRTMTTLFKEVRSKQNLFSAWRHVKKSALNSSNDEMRGEAAEFEHRHHAYLRKIEDQLRVGAFEFDRVKGVLKDKKKRESEGKDPRPIAIATMKNRVVQRALLQVLQPRDARNTKDINTKFTAKVDSRLGKLNDVNRSKYGVGGLMAPFGGVRPAIRLIMESMANGGSLYFQSDIKSFFTKIPTQNIVDQVRSETQDEKLSELFARGLEVDLSNENELLTYARLFPSGGRGVAQGSSLSAFAGNVLLYDLDHELNDMGVVAVRYIDDVVMISASDNSMDDAISYCKAQLQDFGFSLYEPVSGSDKAAQGRCSDSFNFLGCTLQPGRCVPSVKSISNLRSSAEDILSNSRKAIDNLARDRGSFDPRCSRSSVLKKIGEKVYGWEKSFAFCTNREEFQQVDAVIFAKVNDYEGWFSRTTKNLPIDKRMRAIGIPSAASLYEVDKTKKQGAALGQTA